MGNGEAKELICMTHGHELRWGNAGRRGGTGWRGIKERKKWDNCNSIINKIYIFFKSPQIKAQDQMISPVNFAENRLVLIVAKSGACGVDKGNQTNF